jgi:hypothetical protein
MGVMVRLALVAAFLAPACTVVIDIPDGGGASADSNCLDAQVVLDASSSLDGANAQDAAVSGADACPDSGRADIGQLPALDAGPNPGADVGPSPGLDAAPTPGLDAGPQPAGTLAQRLTVCDVSATGGVIAGDMSWRIWGMGPLSVGPVYTVP